MQDTDEDSDGTMERSHDVPSNTTDVQVEEPSSVRSKKSKQVTDPLVKVANKACNIFGDYFDKAPAKMSREEAFEKKAEVVNCELAKTKGSILL